jgi:hypothetical protein
VVFWLRLRLACNHRYSRHNKAICYDPAGAKIAIEQLRLKDNSQNIIIYVTSPNIVNTATPHCGYVRQIVNYGNNNPYLNVLRSKVVDAPLILDLEHMLSSNTENYINVLLNSLQLQDPKILRKDLEGEAYFTFYNVCSWPVAINTFKTIDTRFQSKGSHLTTPIQFVFITLINIGTSIEENRQMAAIRTVRNAISHRVNNPDIIYYNEPRLIQAPPQQVLEERERLSALVLCLGLPIMQLAVQNPNKALQASQQSTSSPSGSTAQHLSAQGSSQIYGK